MGCDMAQGFYFSRAVPAEAMAIMLREQPFLIKE
jgi:EAL domain-containing protein (putative c-di-GMP-specific phosphodiesterase class I)